MNWLLKLLFPNMDRTVRISRDYLPGLKPPTIAPFKPQRKPPQRPDGPDYDAMYQRFKANEAPSAKRKKRKNGFDR
jgi:hypothetical protein